MALSSDRSFPTAEVQGPGRRHRRGLLLAGLLASLLALEVQRLTRDHLPWRQDLSAEGLGSFSPVARSIVRGLGDLGTIDAFFTSDLEHAGLALIHGRLVDQLRSLEALSQGRLVVRFRDPSKDSAARLEATERYRLKPIDVDAVAGATRVTQEVFLGLVVQLEGKSEVLPLVVPDSLELSVVGALKRLSRSAAPRVGLFADPAIEPALEPLRQALAGRLRFETVSGLEQGLAVPSGLDALVVVAPRALAPRAAWELERYAAGGGALLLCLDRVRVKDQELNLEVYSTGLEDWLQSQGLELSGDLVWDLDSAAQLQRPALAYPLMLDLRQERLDPTHPLSARLPAVLLQWASPLTLDPAAGWKAFLSSSPRAFEVPPPDRLSFDPEAVTLYSRQLIATLKPSALTLGAARAGKLQAPPEAPPPDVLTEEGQAVPAAAAELDPRAGPPRLVVIGDSNWLLPIDNSGRPAPQNQALFENAIDWLTADEELLALRARTATPRRLQDFLAEERAALGLEGPAGGVQRARGEQTAKELEASQSAARRRDLAMGLTGLGLLALPLVLLLAARLRSRIGSEGQIESHP